MVGAHPLQGARVLVLEDDFFQADDARRVLRQAGAEVVGPYRRAEDAIAAVTADAPSCALMDINLGRGVDFDPARALLAKNVPVVFLTGYDAKAIPDDLAGVPRLEKPVMANRIVAVVSDAIANSGTR